MSGITTIPRAHPANLAEIGDFVELECLRRADFNVSALDVTRIMERETDRMSQDAVMQYVRDAINGIEERMRHDTGNNAVRALIEEAKHERM